MLRKHKIPYKKKTNYKQASLIFRNEPNPKTKNRCYHYHYHLVASIFIIITNICFPAQCHRFIIVILIVYILRFFGKIIILCINKWRSNETKWNIFILSSSFVDQNEILHSRRFHGNTFNDIERSCYQPEEISRIQQSQFNYLNNLYSAWQHKGYSIVRNVKHR